MGITDFYIKTTKNFNVNILVSGSAPNITGDAVILYLDVNGTELTSSADVTTSGSIGRAMFSLDTDFTDMAPGIYSYELYWTTSADDEYVLDIGEVSVMDRIKY